MDFGGSTLKTNLISVIPDINLKYNSAILLWWSYQWACGDLVISVSPGCLIYW